MSLPQRLGDALSLFLPTNSIYLDLDHPPPPEDDLEDQVPASSSSPPPHPLRPGDGATSTMGSASTPVAAEDDDDPFATPASPMGPSRVSLPTACDRAGPPHHHHHHLAATASSSSSFTRDNPDAVRLASEQARTLDKDEEDTARDPFYDEPPPLAAPSSSSRSPSPTPTSSVVIHQPSPPLLLAVPEHRTGGTAALRGSRRNAHPVAATSGQASPPASSSSFASASGRGGGSGGGGGGPRLLGASRSSALGSRSLMGLMMGGTRYEEGRAGFPFGGVGVGEEDEDEDEEDEEGGDQLSRVETRDDLRGIAASLPPPPSALADSERRRKVPHGDEQDPDEDEDDEDDDDDDPDAPPDFTARIPLVASVAQPHPRRPSLSSSSSAAPGTRRTARPPTRRHGGPLGGIITGRQWAAGMNARERALWRWVNVADLDGFLQQVYLYYVGKGIWAIGLERTLNLLTVGWVIGFGTFLIGCIDYPRLWHSNRLSDVVIPRCTSRMSGFTLLLFMAFAAFYAWRVVRFGLGVRKIWEMHEFYTELLEIPEGDIQTIPWHAIVARLSALRASHPSALSSSSRGPNGHPAERLDAHDVANRIMREENYLIALFNKGLLDLSLPLPRSLRSTVGRVLGKSRFGKSMLTQTLEWNLSFCLLGFLFGPDGQVRRAFLSERNKRELVETLRRRFILMAMINAAFAPFIVLYLLTYSFFRYFEEYHKNPSSIGSRQFTPLAKWKFREFNELPHHFQHRLALAHPLADQYINHYPKAKTVLVSRFVAFLAGSFAAVLILFSLLDPDAFLHFEVTPGRTVLFYIGVFGTVLAVARGMVPDENRVVDPEELMRGIVQHTHYLPAEWKDNLHSSKVHVAFGKLFQMKVVLFVQEILSVLITPFVLGYSLPSCAGPVVDFFREFTVHVDGLGYVCSFAVFDFKRHGDTNFGAPVQATRDQRWKSTEGKMEKSFLTFAASNPAWVPRDQTQSLFLSKMTEASPASQHHRPPAPHTSHHHNHPVALASSQLHPSAPYPRHPPPLSGSAAALTLHSSGVGHPSTNAHYPHHGRGSAATGTGAVRPSRFAPAPLVVEEGDDAEDDDPRRTGPATADEAARVRAAAEKAQLYDRAFAHSVVLHGGASRAAQRRYGRAPPDAGAAGAAAGEIIDEESALDGDAFVAPTEAQPFGLPDTSDEDEDDEDHDGAGGGRGMRPTGARAELDQMRQRGGIGGLVSEMMTSRQ